MTQAKALSRYKIKQHHWLVLGVVMVVSGVLFSVHTDKASATRPDSLKTASVDTQPLALPSKDTLNNTTHHSSPSSQTANEQQDDSAAWQTVKT